MNEEADSAGHALVVEDQADLARVLEFNLTRRGLTVTLAPSLDDARAAVARRRPDLIVLDLMLPDGSGLDFLEETRQDPLLSSVSVLIVSALGEEETVVKGLNLGAEDYVVKPFRVRELVARITGILRRRKSPPADESGETVSRGGIVLDTVRRTVTAAGVPVELTKSEFALVEHFLRNPERVFTRRQLCDQALGSGSMIQERTVDAHMRTIRRKLGDAGTCLATVWGVGYKFTDAT